ncbi:hypothetical protein [Paraburkholderia sp. BR14374]|uniref:hypothetical protein n=1 Tax=Paraburkholderia sp. BR14374 TaxID=3237007 RepID=UPI0034CEE647
MSRRLNYRAGAVAALLAISLCFFGSVRACTIGENVAIELPFNATALSTADRRAIAGAVGEAKKWPNVQIQAIVMAGAYIGERNLEELQDRRGQVVKAYLRKLGIRSEYIMIDPTTLTEGYVVKRPDGSPTVRQIEIELTPICKGSCAWMCDDPRVTPRSRVINP